MGVSNAAQRRFIELQIIQRRRIATGYRRNGHTVAAAKEEGKINICEAILESLASGEDHHG